MIKVNVINEYDDNDYSNTYVIKAKMEPKDSKSIYAYYILTKPDFSIDSISSLHAIEHFGLGRYGDPIDPDGWKKSLHKIQSKIKMGGVFYLGVPVGNKQKLMFNAHRIFLPSSLVKELNQMEYLQITYQTNDNSLPL